MWVERNFSSVDAVREVVANLRFFTNESATITVGAALLSADTHVWQQAMNGELTRAA